MKHRKYIQCSNLFAYHKTFIADHQESIEQKFVTSDPEGWGTKSIALL